MAESLSAHALERRLRGITGWRRRGVALAAGAASVLAMAPFHAWPVLFLTLPVLVWLLDGAHTTPDPRRRMVAAAGAGWWFGFGYFVCGLFWVGEAFLVEAERFAALLPLAVTLLPAGLSLFWAAAAAVAARLWMPGPGRILTLALALAAAEWLRGHVLTGLPWNVLGYALTWPLPLMQSATVLGIYGLTLVAVPILAAPLVLAADARAGRLRPAWGPAGLLVAVVSLAAMLAHGILRLAAAESAAEPETRVRIVQPSVPQREKWRPENQRRIFEQHIALSRRDASGREDGAAGIALVVWPEAAMPFLPLDTPAALAAVGDMLPAGAHLASGALRLEQAAGGRRRVYNSLIVFGAGGAPVAVYDKVHLVPFGEYLPLQALLEAIGLEQLTRLRGGFATGVVPRPLLAIPGLPRLGPLVCYEAIFPAAVVQGAARPAALLNITNDGWFGNTTGPRQHLHQARVRAVEEGLPLLRAANNGISAVVDAKGRMLGRLELDAVGTLDARLPGALAPPPYARFGDGIFAVLWLLGAAALVWLRQRSRAAVVE